MRNPLRHLWVLIVAVAVMAAATAAAEPSRLAQTQLTSPDIVDDLTPDGGREMRPYPNDGAQPAQNPPSFRWRRGKTGDVYEVRIALESGEELVRFSSANLLTLKEPLPTGTHSWRLRRWPAFAAPLEWNGTRSFTIGPDIRRRFVENPADAYARAAERKRPRLLPGEPDRALLIADAYIGWKRDFFDKVAARTGTPPLNLPRHLPALNPGGVDQLPREDLVAFRREIRSSVNRVMRLLHDGLIVWVVTRHLRDDRFGLDQALAAADWLTELDPFGATSNEAADLLNLRVAKALALAYDIAHEELDGGLRRRMLTAIETRVQQTFDAYVVDDSRAIAAYPYNSHGYRHVLGILSIATVVAGDTPRARTWFEAAYPVFIGLGNPWGGDDGGYANGINYGTWEVLNNLAYWDAIRSATGVDYFEAGWAREVSVFLNYIIPPGAPNSGFGDGAEDYRPHVWAETARMLFERTREPLAGHLDAGWRRIISDSGLDASELQEEFASWTFLLGAGQPPAPIDTGGASARRLSGAAVFPSIGWAALHSDLADPDRYSILFKSSPYGSFSHSHADQNSFVINGRREPLAIDSGYYDTHKSRHHLAWTTRTEAHNAITFDGGKGQPWDDIGASGRLTRFTSCPGYDAVAGDATKAYAGQLTAAHRTIVYLRPDQVLVYDHLASATPRRFEWNIHARRRMEPTADGGIRLAMDAGRVCIRQIAGPESAFGQTTDFPREPSTRLQPDWQPQWHGRYTLARPAATADWLFLISLDCARAEVGEVAGMAGGGYRVRIDGRIVGVGPSAELAVPAEGQADPGQCRAPPARDLIAGIRGDGGDTGPHPPAPGARDAIRRLRIGN